MKLIKQFDENDCGAACLAMIAIHFGSYLSITKIREVAGTDDVSFCFTSLIIILTFFSQI